MLRYFYEFKITFLKSLLNSPILYFLRKIMKNNMKYKIVVYQKGYFKLITINHNQLHKLENNNTISKKLKDTVNLDLR